MGRQHRPGPGARDGHPPVGDVADRARHRRARAGLLRVVLRRRRAGRPALRRRARRLRGLDARPGAGRRPAAALRVLGAHDRLLLPPDRARLRAAGQQARRHPGARGDHVRRPRAPRGRDRRRPGRRDVPHHRDPGRPAHGCGRDRRCPAPPGGRRQQVGPAPLPLLAPVGHGGTDPGQRLPARRVDGQGRRLPRRAPGTRLRRRDRMAHGAAGARPRDDGPRRRTSTPPARPQAAARLRHRQPARLPRARPRHRHPQRDARRARPPARARVVQGDPLPGRRRDRPQHRHARPP